MVASTKPEPTKAQNGAADVKRDPIAEFAAVEAGRPPYDHSQHWEMSKTPNPEWKIGSGASIDCKDRKFLAIDPQEEGRSVVSNYKLMISSTVPRPIAMVSTVTADGQTKNLAPFSFYNCVTADPPTYTVACSGRVAKDTLANALATGECCISMTSDWLIEAANFAAVDTPRNISEWELTGLTPIPGDVVKAPYIAESPFSIECKVLHHQDLFSVNKPDVRTCTLLIVQAVRFHIWEDALSEDGITADMAKLRPVFRAGGVVYGTGYNGFELLRPEFANVEKDPEAQAVLQQAQSETNAHKDS